MLQQTKFDYILIETTGLANPGPVASALWTDEELEAGALANSNTPSLSASRSFLSTCLQKEYLLDVALFRIAWRCCCCCCMYTLSGHACCQRHIAWAGVVLDGIVTVVDAKHILRQLQRRSAPPANTSEAPKSSSPLQAAPQAAPDGIGSAGHSSKEAARVNEAQQQIAYADVVLLNKTDLVTEEQLQSIESAIKRHNSTVKVSSDSSMLLTRVCCSCKQASATAQSCTVITACRCMLRLLVAQPLFSCMQVVRCHRCQVDISTILNQSMYRCIHDQLHIAADGDAHHAAHCSDSSCQQPSCRHRHEVDHHNGHDRYCFKPRVVPAT